MVKRSSVLSDRFHRPTGSGAVRLRGDDVAVVKLRVVSPRASVARPNTPTRRLASVGISNRSSPEGGSLRSRQQE
jgi:hypothetical protein